MYKYVYVLSSQQVSLAWMEYSFTIIIVILIFIIIINIIIIICEDKRILTTRAPKLLLYVPKIIKELLCSSKVSYLIIPGSCISDNGPHTLHFLASFMLLLQIQNTQNRDVGIMFLESRSSSLKLKDDAQTEHADALNFFCFLNKSKSSSILLSLFSLQFF